MTRHGRNLPPAAGRGSQIFAYNLPIASRLGINLYQT
jgi:hypothetical protein